MKTIKSCYLDANVLVYYQDLSSPLHDAASRIIENLLANGFSLTLSSLSLDEYEYTVLSSINKPKLEVWKRLRVGFSRLLKIPAVSLINPPLELKKHRRILNIMVKFGLKPRDAYHLFIMLANKVKFLATFDNDFDKVFESGRIKKFE